jgi:hypothetical protein
MFDGLTEILPVFSVSPDWTAPVATAVMATDRTARPHAAAQFETVLRQQGPHIATAVDRRPLSKCSRQASRDPVSQKHRPNSDGSAICHCYDRVLIITHVSVVSRWLSRKGGTDITAYTLVHYGNYSVRSLRTFVPYWQAICCRIVYCIGRESSDKMCALLAGNLLSNCLLRWQGISSQIVGCNGGEYPVYLCAVLAENLQSNFMRYWQRIPSRIVCGIGRESPVELCAVLAENLQSNCVRYWQRISSRIVCCIGRESPVERCAFWYSLQQAGSVYMLLWCTHILYDILTAHVSLQNGAHSMDLLNLIQTRQETYVYSCIEACCREHCCSGSAVLHIMSFSLQP